MDRDITSPTTGNRAEDVVESISEGNSVAILPQNPNSSNDLSVVFNEKVTNTNYQWFINGSPVEEAQGPVLSHDLFKKGDEVYVKVTTDKGELRSQPVIISNSPPSIKQALLLPEFPTITSSLNLSIKTEDPDGDPVTLRYEWYVNGEIQPEDTETLKDAFKKGDEVMVKVYPSDGEDEGSPATRSVTIQNSPPVFTQIFTDQSFKEDTYTASVRAEDPDGDPVSYELQEAPEGMKIAPDGTVSWTVSGLPDQDQFVITVLARDSEGAETLLKIPLRVKPLSTPKSSS